ncbi:peptidoglycan-binding domain 1 protein [Moniliophthora roreri]|nr:peptidoglycan-binding domain 1 protein [Moniliophthora roreri]
MAEDFRIGSHRWENIFISQCGHHIQADKLIFGISGLINGPQRSMCGCANMTMSGGVSSLPPDSEVFHQYLESCKVQAMHTMCSLQVYGIFLGRPNDSVQQPKSSSLMYRYDQEKTRWCRVLEAPLPFEIDEYIRRMRPQAFKHVKSRKSRCLYCESGVRDRYHQSTKQWNFNFNVHSTDSLCLGCNSDDYNIATTSSDETNSCDGTPAQISNINVTTRSLPLRITVTPVSDFRESRLDIIVEFRRMSNVDLVSVGMGVGATCMADFCSTSDDEGTDAGGLLQSNDTINSTGEDTIVGCASRIAFIGTSAGGGCGNSLGD